jgi:apolipoprotein N-acyltransferase
VLSALRTGSSGALIADVPLERRLTPYVRWGDTWAFAGVLMAVAAAVPAQRRRSA